jgi:hypothetical protein
VTEEKFTRKKKVSSTTKIVKDFEVKPLFGIYPKDRRKERRSRQRRRRRR